MGCPGTKVVEKRCASNRIEASLTRKHSAKAIRSKFIHAIAWPFVVQVDMRDLVTGKKREFVSGNPFDRRS
jgi:hypothetical protein